LRYKRLILLLAAFATIWIFFRLPHGATYFVSFDEAQVVDYYTPRDLINFYQKLSKKKWRIATRLYKRNLAGKQTRHKKERIPKIIHQIWLEEGPIPKKIQIFQETWKKQHPNWEYHLWTKDEIVFFYLQNRPLYDALPNAKAKTEILRYEILYQFGGLFVDSNFECLKPCDILNENCDFYASLTDQIRAPELSSSLIAATPRHAIIQKCIRKFREQSSEAFMAKMSSHDLTEHFFHVVKRHSSQINVALPATFFYSLPKSAEEIPHFTHSFAIRRLEED